MVPPTLYSSNCITVMSLVFKVVLVHDVHDMVSADAGVHITHIYRAVVTDLPLFFFCAVDDCL